MFITCETICVGVHVDVHRSMNVVQIPYIRTFESGYIFYQWCILSPSE